MNPKKAEMKASYNKNTPAIRIMKMNTRVELATNTLHVGHDNFFNSGTAGLNKGIANKINPIAPTIVIIHANNLGKLPINGVVSFTVNTLAKINKPNAIATILKKPNKYVSHLYSVVKISTTLLFCNSCFFSCLAV